MDSFHAPLIPDYEVCLFVPIFQGVPDVFLPSLGNTDRDFRHVALIFKSGNKRFFNMLYSHQFGVVTVQDDSYLRGVNSIANNVTAYFAVS